MDSQAGQTQGWTSIGCSGHLILNTPSGSTGFDPGGQVVKFWAEDVPGSGSRLLTIAGSNMSKGDIYFRRSFMLNDGIIFLMPESR